MTGRDQCPDEATLLQMIDGAIHGARGEQLSGHIDDCIDCQGVIEKFGSQGGEGLDGNGDLQKSGVPNECNAAVRRLIRIAHGQTLPRSSDIDRMAGPVPESMEHFRIQEVIATGGMGTIYRAWDEQLNRVVAIKQLNLLLTSDNQLQRRILDEARTAAKIQHPGVVAVHSVHEDSSPPFFVMEYVDGHSLQARLSECKRLSVAETVRITCDLLKALVAAHAENVIHCDIKPANVLLDDSTERARLTDFGIAQAFVTDAGEPQRYMGTPHFMSPEQYLGEPVAPRTDLFSLGALLYRMLAGVLPFEALINLTSEMHQWDVDRAALRLERVRHASQFSSDLAVAHWLGFCGSALQIE